MLQPKEGTQRETKEQNTEETNKTKTRMQYRSSKLIITFGTSCRLTGWDSVLILQGAQVQGARFWQVRSGTKIPQDMGGTAKQTSKGHIQETKTKPKTITLNISSSNTVITRQKLAKE